MNKKLNFFFSFLIEESIVQIVIKRKKYYPVKYISCRGYKMYYINGYLKNKKDFLLVLSKDEDKIIYLGVK